MENNLAYQNPNQPNPHMRLPLTAVSVIDAPDALPKVYPYSHTVAQQQFNQLDKDIFQQVKKTKPANRKKTPVAAFCFAGAAAIAALCFAIKGKFKF